MNLKGLFSFAAGGVLLIFVLYFVFSSALSEQRIAYSSFVPLVNGLALGFVAFLLLGLGLSLIVESAAASRR